MNLISDYLSSIGKKGGKNTLKNKGKEHFSLMGKRSAQKKKEQKLSTERT